MLHADLDTQHGDDLDNLRTPLPLTERQRTLVGLSALSSVQAMTQVRRNCSPDMERCRTGSARAAHGLSYGARVRRTPRRSGRPGCSTHRITPAQPLQAPCSGWPNAAHRHPQPVTDLLVAQRGVTGQQLQKL